ncbi:hypothetical protein ACFO3A_08535 [Comamonas nitrativorans]|uniref:DUF115 domain-containing protein n=2 Tax=Comamonas nitrativorans TaxID=108437 RepID=A0ABV9GZ83_9BURK
MDITQLVCLSNFFSSYRAAPESFFAFVQEPIRQGCGIDPGWLPTAKKPSALLPGFNLQKFRTLAGWSTMHATHFWMQTWHTAPASAVDYLFAYVPQGTLILSYDMPPWLAQACEQRGFDWLDMRPSPLAFGRDLYVALHASNAVLQQHLVRWSVSDEELRLEAALLAANLHAHRLDIEEGFHYKFNLDGCLVFVGQHPEDAALLSPDGHSLRCTDFSEQLRELAKGKTMLHLLDRRNLGRAALAPHISDLWTHVKRECETLKKIVNAPVQICQQNIYQILSSDDDVQLVGISAPALQEAAWFDKPAHELFRPRTPLATMHASPDAGERKYVQVHFTDVLKPAFWHAVLTPDAPYPKLPALPELERNQARTGLNNWGDYEKVMTWERPLHTASFERSGGGLLRKRIEKLEQSQNSVATASSMDDAAMQAKIRTLKDTKKGLTAYVLGNGPSLNELNAVALLKEESFWCNQAYELERQNISFTPKYYFVGSPTGFQEFGHQMMAVKAEKKFFRDEVYRLAQARFPQSFPDQNVIKYGGPPRPLMFEEGEHFSADPSLFVNAGATILVEAIQFAFYMGYERVYVGGVDLDYSSTPYFFGGQSLDYVPRDAWSENMRQSFIVAKHYFEKHGRILAKITKSPNLPLNYVKIQEMWAKP